MLSAKQGNVNIMVEVDLRSLRCPQQFVQFKLALKRAQGDHSRLLLLLNTNTQEFTDIERYLKKQGLSYALQRQPSFYRLIVEI